MAPAGHTAQVVPAGAPMPAIPVPGAAAPRCGPLDPQYLGAYIIHLPSSQLMKVNGSLANGIKQAIEDQGNVYLYIAYPLPWHLISSTRIVLREGLF